MKEMNPPLPISKAFLVCDQIAEDSTSGRSTLIGLPTGMMSRHFPVGHNLGVFARWTSAHGDYRVEVQLQAPEGNVVWREGPQEPWSLNDPLRLYDLKFNLCVVFPEPGAYDIVILANDEEVARQPFMAEVLSPAPK